MSYYNNTVNHYPDYTSRIINQHGKEACVLIEHATPRHMSLFNVLTILC